MKSNKLTPARGASRRKEQSRYKLTQLSKLAIRIAKNVLCCWGLMSHPWRVVR